MTAAAPCTHLKKLRAADDGSVTCATCGALLFTKLTRPGDPNCEHNSIVRGFPDGSRGCGECGATLLPHGEEPEPVVPADEAGVPDGTGPPEGLAAP